MKTNIARLASSMTIALGTSLASVALAQNTLLTYVDSTLDAVILLDPVTGAPVNFSFIGDINDPQTYDLSTPIEAIQVNDEIWLSDQISDAIFRFTANETAPTFIAAIRGQVDNMRGLAKVGNRVYVSNAGTANGAPGSAILVYETDGTRVGHIVVTNPLTNLPVDPFDVADFNGRLLITDIQGEDLVVCDVDGSNVQVLFDGNSNLMDFPQQVTVSNTGPGNTQELWVNAFSSPAGVYRFSTAGVQLNYYPVTTGGRGVWPLPDASGAALKFLFTDGVVVTGGLQIFDTGTGLSSQFFGGGGRFIAKVTFIPPLVCNDIDMNNDGSSFDPQDIDAFLSVFSEGPCIPDTNICDNIDFNNDGSIFDPCDIDSFLVQFSEGPCTLCGT